MQIHAIGEKGPVIASGAEKRKDYTCPECQGLVRLRGGDVRKSHFFHLQSTSHCRLAQKGMIHLRLQKYIQYLFEDEAAMEVAFPSIGRIADVACCRSKKVFEIQYSPMSLEEAEKRTRDYEAVGYEVIWILHDDTFNQRKIAPCEHFLRTKASYYANMDAEGNGVIYDQLEAFVGSKRKVYSEALPVNLRKSFPLPHRQWAETLSWRSLSWKRYHEGDCFHLVLTKRMHAPTRRRSFFLRLKGGYRFFFHALLRKVSSHSMQI